MFFIEHLGSGNCDIQLINQTSQKSLVENKQRMPSRNTCASLDFIFKIFLSCVELEMI